MELYEVSDKKSTFDFEWVSDKIICSKLLSGFKNVLHGTTTKLFNPNFRSKEEDILKLLNYLPHKFDKIVFLDQVHSNNVFILNDSQGFSAFNKCNENLFEVPSTDGIIVNQMENVLVVICTADCLPILLLDPIRKIIGGVHSGWKGTRFRIIQMAIKKMISFGAKPEDILIWIGPSIGVCCYEVGDELIKDFKYEFKDWRDINKGRNLDLKRLNFLQALESGIKEENIEVSDFCTLCNKEIFHSYRSNGEKAGRILSFIALLIS